jgi:hypothetical protein
MGGMTSMVVHLFMHKQTFSRANLDRDPTQQKEKYYHWFLYSLRSKKYACILWFEIY